MAQPGAVPVAVAMMEQTSAGAEAATVTKTAHPSALAAT